MESVGAHESFVAVIGIVVDPLGYARGLGYAAARHVGHFHLSATRDCGDLAKNPTLSPITPTFALN